MPGEIDPNKPADPKPAEPAKPGLPSIEQVIVPKTGDPATDIAVGFFAKSGISADDPAVVAALSGDTALLRAKAAEKGIQGGDAYVAVIESVAVKAKALADAARERSEAVVSEVVGGKENWAKVKTFIESKATAEELEDINASLRAGGLRARITAEYVKKVYEAGVGALVPEVAAPVVDPNRAAVRGPDPANQPLSPREYAKAVQELSRKVGPGYVTQSPEYAALGRRRAAYRG